MRLTHDALGVKMIYTLEFCGGFTISKAKAHAVINKTYTKATNSERIFWKRLVLGFFTHFHWRSIYCQTADSTLITYGTYYQGMYLRMYVHTYVHWWAQESHTKQQPTTNHQQPTYNYIRLSFHFITNNYVTNKYIGNIISPRKLTWGAYTFYKNGPRQIK